MTLLTYPNIIYVPATSHCLFCGIC